jgi:hypothetical protein
LKLCSNQPCGFLWSWGKDESLNTKNWHIFSPTEGRPGKPVGPVVKERYNSAENSKKKKKREESKQSNIKQNKTGEEKKKPQDKQEQLRKE